MNRVLIAEDEGALRLLAADTLEASGMTVLQARDGLEAIELLSQHPEIEVLVSDVKMPRMDGYQLAEAAFAMRPDLTLIFMTGYAAEPPPAVLRGKNIRTFHKPFDFDELAEHIRIAGLATK